MQRKVAITGIGLVTPGGTLPSVWDTLLRGQSTAREIDTFDISSYPVRHAGIVDNGDMFAPFSPRLLKRMDRFCCLAMVAAQQALQDSGLELETLDHSSIGTYIGNMYGGWGMTDPSLRNLLRRGYREVSPYVASAWFPTAPQGQITIHWGLKGYSKTIVADTASSALAIGYAARLIQQGRAEVMVAGGAEAPITPYTYTFCTRSNRLSPTGYQIFDPLGAGFLVGEGAVLLVLEEFTAAQRRGAHIYAELAGWATGYHPHEDDPWNDEGQHFSRIVRQALNNAGIHSGGVDYIGLDAQGLFRADNTEAQALAQALGSDLQEAAVTTCKPTLTHLLGAGAAAEIATALLAIQQKVIPPIAENIVADRACPLNLVTHTPYQTSVKTALVNARGTDGVQTAVVLKAV
jgi:3-oxoacyl-[acyl-carrier-protein] synthase II